MAWTLYKEVRYAVDGIPGENLTDFPKLVSIVADADIAAELSGGGGIKFTSPDGSADLAFGLYPSTALASGTVLARVKLTLLTAATAGDVACRLYYSASESTTEDKAGTVSADYVLFAPLEEDPSGSAPQMLDWVSETLLGTSAGTMTSGDLVTAQVGKGLDFDGGDDYIDFGDLGDAIDGVQKVTIEGIGKRLGTFDYVTLGKSASGGSRIAILYFNDGRIYFAVGGSFASFANNDTNRHGTVLVFDGSLTGNARLAGYLDGVVKTLSYVGTVPSTTPANASGFRVGFALDGVGVNKFTEGQWDEVRVSDVARSANWLAFAFVDDFDNADTFTLSAEQSGGVSTSPSPVTATLTPVAPTTRLSTAAAPATLSLTVVAPSASSAIETAATPVGLTLSVITPTTKLTTAATAVTAALTPVAPAASKSTPATPVGLTLTVVTPATQIATTLTPVGMTATPVAPSHAGQVAVSPLSLTVAPIAVTTRITRSLTPLAASIAIVAAATSISHAVAPVAMQANIVAVTTNESATAGNIFRSRIFNSSIFGKVISP